MSTPATSLASILMTRRPSCRSSARSTATRSSSHSSTSLRGTCGNRIRPTFASGSVTRGAALLLGGRLPLDRAALRDTAVLLRPVQPPDGPRLSDVVEELRQLAEFRTREELIAALRQRFGTSPGSCYFDTVTVRIPPEQARRQR